MSGQSATEGLTTVVDLPKCLFSQTIVRVFVVVEFKAPRSAGNVLQDGDTVTVIKDLKLKGSGGTVKIGTKVKNIRLVDGDHDIDCKIDGFGAMSLKSEFVRKC